MSPEQIQGSAVGGAADQFALGVIVYELLCGKKPFMGETLPALFYQICKNDAERVDRVNPALNETAGKVMDRALAKFPENRFSTCSEFLGALAFAIGESPNWVPIAPDRKAEAGGQQGNGWHAPTTIVSGAGGIEEPIEPLRDVYTPAPFPKPTTAFVMGEQAGTATVDRSSRHREVSSGGTLARRLAMVAALLLAVLGALVFVVRMNSNPGMPTQVLDTKNGPTVAPTPEDLQTSAKQISTPPADLSTSKDEADGLPANASGAQVSEPVPAVKAPPAWVKQTPIPAPKVVRKTAVRPLEPTVPVTSDVELSADPPGARIVVDRRAELDMPSTLFAAIANWAAHAFGGDGWIWDGEEDFQFASREFDIRGAGEECGSAAGDERAKRN